MELGRGRPGHRSRELVRGILAHNRRRELVRELLGYKSTYF
jgi:hypothetical protein